MNITNFNLCVAFNLDDDDNLDLFEYFHLSRCAVAQVLDRQKRRPRSNRGNEIAGVVARSVAKLDSRHGRDHWSSEVLRYADIFFEAARKVTVRGPETILNLYPSVYRRGFHSEVLDALAEPPTLSDEKALVQLSFENDFAMLDPLEAYALCRGYVRQRLARSLAGTPLDLSGLVAVIAALVDYINEYFGEEWFDRLESGIAARPTASTSQCERIVGLFPALRQLGLTHQVVATWGELVGEKAAAPIKFERHPAVLH